MTLELRQTGIDGGGDIPWGTHFCLFYEMTDDILDTAFAKIRARVRGTALAEIFLGARQ